jgi:hypothetical protein
MDQQVKLQAVTVLLTKGILQPVLQTLVVHVVVVVMLVP